MKNPKIKIFADTSAFSEMLELAKNPKIQGFTTNPSLMRKAGIRDYEHFARTVLETIPNRPISFEVIADSAKEMIRQGKKIASWGENVWVKIPITNTKGRLTGDAITELTASDIRVNITAVMTLAQVKDVLRCVAGEAIISIFAGRMADIGIDPSQLALEAVDCVAVHGRSDTKLLWASSRQTFDVLSASQFGFNIITLTPDLIKKLPLLQSRGPTAYSLETVKQFHRDAVAADYKL